MQYAVNVVNAVGTVDAVNTVNAVERVDTVDAVDTVNAIDAVQWSGNAVEWECSGVGMQWSGTVQWSECIYAVECSWGTHTMIHRAQFAVDAQ